MLLPLRGSASALPVRKPPSAACMCVGYSKQPTRENAHRLVSSDSSGSKCVFVLSLWEMWVGILQTPHLHLLLLLRSLLPLLHFLPVRLLQFLF